MPASLAARLSGLLKAVVALLLSAGVAHAAALIPRGDLFGNPERASAKISPDGSRIALLAPRDGVLNVWVAPTGDIDAAKPLTQSRERPIRQFFWSASGDSVIYLNDKAGDENYLLYAVDVASGAETALTPFEKTRAIPIKASWRHPDDILVGLNDRDPQWHDLYRVNVKTGERTLVLENTERLDEFVADDDLVLRFVSRTTDDGGTEILRVGDDGKSLQTYTTIPYEDALTGMLGLTSDGKTLYMDETRGRDKVAVTATDLASGETKVIAESEVADVSSLITDPESDRALAYGVDYLTTTWTAIDPAIAPDIAFLNEHLKGNWSIASQTRDNATWVILSDPVTEPANYQIYKRADRTLTPLFTIRPKLKGAPLSAMYPIEIRARDGLTLVAYLTLPKDSDPDGDGRPPAPLAMVLNVHGGPWARDSYGYDPEAQWLANRGYAVLQVNYRGSSGFGKAFINAGDREWGGKMHDDLIDAVNWAVMRGIARRDRIAIYGGSYGGYAALVGLTFTPTTFACGVDIVGVANLTTFMNTIPPYWESFREQMYRRVGDPRTQEGLAFLKSRSPVTKADAIVRPLLIAQGANDPRVNKAESDQIAAAMTRANIPVTYVLYPDEGHGFARPENRKSFYAIAEAFLSGCIGGRFEPIGDDFAGASLEVLEGADAVPGLKAALDSQ
ncbi:MAG: prolyl oligopeptidase family serine peptidase [Alphaproteobacteria bacterium]|nr:prolyl oligopeptidase family serine peptidase [Alphaproteobacteria bacterium]